MAYQIDRYNRTLLTVVEDGTLDETTDLRFIGKNYAGYGEIHNENFLFLLENFANANPPPRAISGQVWFDSSQSKLKFYDGSIWRSTGGSEVSASQPVGLTTGDFWWDSGNDQLYVYNGASFVLIGPQDAGAGTTQLVSQTILDDESNSRSIIVALVNDIPIAVFSPTSFTILDEEGNRLDGFTNIAQGITLKNSVNGNTTSLYRFWGTATNADKLGNKVASDFVTFDNLDFTGQLIEAGIDGLSIADDFIIKGDASGSSPMRGVIQNISGPNNEIHFKTLDATETLVHSLTINSTGLLPAATDTFVLGNSSSRFSEIYAGSFKGGSADKADTLQLSAGTYLSASESATPSTIVARTASNAIFANEFNGTATSAKYADLAEKYTTDQEYATGTIVAVALTGDAELTAADRGGVVVGIVSEKPAFLMNSESAGQAIALKGRVPVRVEGKVKKGDEIYVADSGVGSAIMSPTRVGVALEGKDSLGEDLVECVVLV